MVKLVVLSSVKLHSYHSFQQIDNVTIVMYSKLNVVFVYFRYLSNNQLKMIGSNVFDKLVSLNYL